MQNAIIGDSIGTDLPRMEVDEKQLIEEKRMANYAKSPEFAKIKAHFEERIGFYQSWLPNGQPVTASLNMVETGQQWVVANAIIGELKAILDTYAQVTEEVENAQEVLPSR